MSGVAKVGGVADRAIAVVVERAAILKRAVVVHYEVILNRAAAAVLDGGVVDQ